MGIGGVSQGGASSGGGSSRMFDRLPFQNYRDPATDGSRAWVEEFINALGEQFDGVDVRFASAQARANLLDPTYTPVEIASASLATATAAPTGATSTDTMLDVLCYIAGVPTPVDTNLTIAQKQALVQLGWTALKRKGNRLQLLKIASLIGDGVCAGWTVPPFSFSIILPDGDPSPGFGSWVPASGSVAKTRPWIFSSVRNMLLANVFPGWAQLGVGYSQFRAGYSAAGEVVMPSGSRLNLLSHEHFDAFGGGNFTGWTNEGSVINATQGTSGTATYGANINFEFTSNCAMLDLSGAVAGNSVYLSQAGVVVNNQVTHRFQIDYAYRQASAPFLPVLTAQIYDETNQYYYNPATQTWGSSSYYFTLPVAAAAGTRTRFACDVVMQADSSTSSVMGTASVKVKFGFACDGTATSQIKVAVYRVGLYEKFDSTIEGNAGGERIMWEPLVDTASTSQLSRGAAAVIVEPANAVRSAFKTTLGSNRANFPYHPALTARGYLSNSTWTNLIKGSNDFGADWTQNATRTANGSISPIVGETSPTAVKFTATAVSSNVLQSPVVGNPASKVYVAGVWAKKITADTIAPSGTVSTTAGSATVTGSGTAFSSSWVNRTITIAGVSYVVLSVGGVTSLTLGVNATATVSGQAFTISTTDITLTLGSAGHSSFSSTYTLGQADGWRWLAMPASSFGAGDGGSLQFKIAFPSADAACQVALSTAYCYEITSKARNSTTVGIVYPPLAQTGIGATGDAGATTLNVNVSGANKHPLTLRGMTSTKAGLLKCTVVPMFDGTNQPDGTIFDFGQSLTQNRFVLKVSSGALVAEIFDNASSGWFASITLSNLIDPPVGSMTWRRDTAIAIRVRWQNGVSIDLSAGNGNATTAIGTLTLSDASLAGIGIGNNFTGGAGQFDGIVTGVESMQIGGPF